MDPGELLSNGEKGAGTLKPADDCAALVIAAKELIEGDEACGAPALRGDHR